MAYFANNENYAYYEENYCSRCVHFKGKESFGCAVLDLHWLWNYDACNGDRQDATPEERAKHLALNHLWPREEVGNGQCSMFYKQRPRRSK